MRPGIRRVGWPLGATLVCALFVAPLALMVLGSFRGAGQPPPESLEVVPADPGLDGYERAFDAVPLGRALLNSLVLAGIAAPLAVIAASLAGFALARMSRRARRRGLV